MPSQTEVQSLAEVTVFLNKEADMLDHNEYEDWLSLWSAKGLYIVPIDHKQTDHKNALNVAYDDAEMRVMRTARLSSGEAVSTQEANFTIRTLSRIRILGEENDFLDVRCAYCLYENKKSGLRLFPADVEFKLRRVGDDFEIEEKVVRVMKSDQYLATASYLF
jgi:3-phenylpropionate/cinnamic acid dioxygenase small subunit